MRAGILGKVKWRRLDDALHPLLKRTLTLSGEDASAASSFEATTSVPAAIDSSQDTDVLNFHLKRLVIIEGDGDATPGQGDLLSTHALPASAMSGKSSRLCIG
ncbi:hypothetical protein IscW_ISCW012806 [Ixodes scapularis]|uniref:Uncharacterized protein n=1 Tax=Ixodes scapularis TaxID=6945 RepID=B7QAQ1_IXOSC|nr:hypothetical protein IscW_ISCW012806 [Ixodes scapularis]|eukprot:XP_002412627.1 hypothetical protein IscW_ISCW012806 [Ixodes scapularis]